jgi:glutathione S-transferase
METALTFYGLDLSYFTGKVEAFLRYREIPHHRIELSTKSFNYTAQQTGLAQMPAIQLADGRWMTDSTPMMAWIDQHCPGPSIFPANEAARFFSLLLEDYADEWLWRPALHFRWSYAPDKYLMSHRIAAEMLHDVPLPLFLRKAMILRRQVSKYVRGDGVTAATIGHVESIYLRNLGFLETMLQTRPYLMGTRPSVVDFGFFASMFRHFGLDPTPARLMRDLAPGVYEWLARMWNARASRLAADAALLDQIPADWGPVLDDIGLCYLPYLLANAKAFAAGKKYFDLTLEGTAYRLPVHEYRVWCLGQLQAHFKALQGHDAALVHTGLERRNILGPLNEFAAPLTKFSARPAPFCI